MVQVVSGVVQKAAVLTQSVILGLQRVTVQEVTQRTKVSPFLSLECLGVTGSCLRGGSRVHADTGRLPSLAQGARVLHALSQPCLVFG